jgi:uncharacterized OsmC-like protein
MKIRNGYEKIKVTFKIKVDTSKEKTTRINTTAQKRSPVIDIV